jgi:hypothetical protein
MDGWIVTRFWKIERREAEAEAEGGGGGEEKLGYMGGSDFRGRGRVGSWRFQRHGEGRAV